MRTFAAILLAASPLSWRPRGAPARSVAQPGTVRHADATV
jgi:hypothetical protein